MRKFFNRIFYRLKKKGLNYSLLLTICALLTTILISFSNLYTPLPSKWTNELTLSYSESHGMSGDYCNYSFNQGILQIKLKTAKTNERVINISLHQKQLDTLLMVLKSNDVEKIKLTKRKDILYDASAYSLHLTKNHKPIVNISNSAYDELKGSDKEKFKKIVQFIKGFGLDN